jgi:dTDP-4-amino-4,6-dideoxygalactose transaminase
MPQEGGGDRLIELFSLEGIAPERLILHPRDRMESYLALHHQVDFCLDTFPYAGGTTTLHALWMGVPTLTIAGDTAPGRGGACNLGHVGLSEFIADNKADFVRKGLLWADDLVALSNLRADLRGRFKSSAMGQPAPIAANLDIALRAMWRRWCVGRPIESFEVTWKSLDNITPEVSQKMVGINQEVSPIYVTQPFLPPLEEFIPYLQQIWKSKQLTNGGPFHQKLEQELCDHLGVKYISLFSNGTLALMTAMQALRITGEVITTPYSFVATAHSLLWNGIKPVFVDIDPITLNLDPSKIEAAITPQTTAIMPVHCYGHPCDVKGIQKVADNYNLKVIYDAAHAFGVECPDGSILNHGDLSVLSFHATKVFNTFEGGAIVCHDAKTKTRIDQLKNFGFVDEVTVVATGINGKMSELNAAFGLLQLKNIAQALQNRKLVDARYRAALSGVKGIHYLIESGEKIANYAYFPILVTPDYLLSRDKLYQKLRDNGIYARRYFYPLVSDFPMYRGMPSAAHTNLPVAKKVAESVICLPIYPDLSNEQIDFIVGLISQENVE